MLIKMYTGKMSIKQGHDIETSLFAIICEILILYHKREILQRSQNNKN